MTVKLFTLTQTKVPAPVTHLRLAPYSQGTLSPAPGSVAPVQSSSQLAQPSTEGLIVTA